MLKASKFVEITLGKPYGCLLSLAPMDKGICPNALFKRSLCISMTLLLLMLSIRMFEQLGIADDRVRLIWRYPLSVSSVPPSAKPVIAKQMVFVVSSEILALSQDSGRLLWQMPLRNYIPSSLLAKDNAILVCEDTVSALDVKTGRRFWEFKPDANTSLGRPAIHGDVLYFGTSSHRLYAMHISSKREMWQLDFDANWQFPAVVRGIAFSRGILYVTIEQWRTANGVAATGWLVAVDANTGRVLWRFSTGSQKERRGLSSTPAVADSQIIAGDYLSNALVAINRLSGKQNWRFQGNSGFVGFPEAPIVKKGVVYAGSGDGNFYAINADTGTLVWRTKLGGAIQAYVMCGHSLLVNDGGLAVLSPATGDFIQSFFRNGGEVLSSNITERHAHAYVMGPQGVYAFSCR